MVQRIGWKSFLYLTIGAPLLAILLFYASPKVHQVVNVTTQNLKIYYAKNQSALVRQSSVGLRLDFLKNSWKLVKQRPIFGFGTGSFPYAYHTIDQKDRLNEPSNSYVHLTVQIGFVGLAIFMLWLIMQLWETRLLPKTERYLAQGIILSFMITSCFVSGFLRQQIALLYFIFLTVFFASGLPHTD
jgi:O-antigen ligase